MSSGMSSRKQPRRYSTLPLDIATRHASSEEVVGAAFVLGNVKVATNGSRAATSKATINGTRKGTKGRKKGQKHRRHDSNNEKANDSDEEYVTAAERDFKHQTQ
jgi:hypothetical protein